MRNWNSERHVCLSNSDFNVIDNAAKSNATHLRVQTLSVRETSLDYYLRQNGKEIGKIIETEQTGSIEEEPLYIMQETFVAFCSKRNKFRLK